MEIPYDGPPLEWLLATPERWSAYLAGYESGFLPGIETGRREVDRAQLVNSEVDVERAFAEADAACPLQSWDYGIDGDAVLASRELWPTFLAGYEIGGVAGQDRGREDAIEGWEDVRDAWRESPLAGWSPPAALPPEGAGPAGEQVTDRAARSWATEDDGYG